jgi:hypothetical protein
MPDPNARARDILVAAQRSIRREEQNRGALALTFTDLVRQAQEETEVQLARADKETNRLEALVEQLKARPPETPPVADTDNVFSGVIETE